MTKFDTLRMYDTCRSRVQPRERPGTHPNQFLMPKYPSFDLSHYSVDQMVLKLERWYVWLGLIRFDIFYNCWTWDRPGTHPNKFLMPKYPSFDLLHYSGAQMVLKLERCYVWLGLIRFDISNNCWTWDRPGTLPYKFSMPK